MSDDNQMDRWQEAKEQLGTIIRWDEVADKGQEQTLYLGPTVQGIYVDKKTNIGANKSNLYEIELADGRKVSIWGSALLDGKFDLVPVGSEVRITYLGMEKAKQSARSYRTFRVEFAKPTVSFNEVNTEKAADAGQTAAPTATDEGY
jgi:hypothetical protein